jgi:hypothetical protein
MVDQAEEVTEREKLIAEANALVEEQKEARGYTAIEGEQRKQICALIGLPANHPVLRLNPYTATHESELRARKIVALRRQAARLEGQR